jgi:hypothetical protein
MLAWLQTTGVRQRSVAGDASDGKNGAQGVGSCCDWAAAPLLRVGDYNG